MSDLSAGTTVRGLDTPPTLSNEQNDSYTATNTTFGIAASGTYVDCGVAFVGPTSGRVLVLFGGQMQHSVQFSAGELSPFIRLGATVGSGATFLASDISRKVRLVSASAGSIQHAGSSVLVSGLTAGDDYNVRLDHRTNGATVTIVYRHVIVLAVP